MDGYFKVKNKGVYSFVCRDREGKIKWQEEIVENLVVYEGLDLMLNVTFHDIAKPAGWYIGLIKTAIVVANADTLASHGGWTEATEYTGNRQAFTVVDSTARSVTNSASPATFNINDTVTVKGGFLCTVATGSSGTLMGGAAFTQGDRSCVSGDSITVTYSFACASA